jgi:hypothetical protein
MRIEQEAEWLELEARLLTGILPIWFITRRSRLGQVDMAIGPGGGLKY